MGYANLQDCVKDLQGTGQLKIIDAPIDPYLEMAAIQRRVFAKGGPALLFTWPKGCVFPMLANLFGTMERASYIFRDTLPHIKKLFSLKARPASFFEEPIAGFRALAKTIHMPPKSQSSWESKSPLPVLSQSCQLQDLPRLVSWPEDGGAFITLPLVYSEDEDGHSNLGMYRAQLWGNDYARDEIGLHYQLQRGIGVHHAQALAKGRTLPVHIYVGGPPALTVAAVMPLPENISEIIFAGLLAGRRMWLDDAPGFRLPVLAECDFLIQGEIDGSTKPEGPFGDHLGYYSLKHDFPVMRVKKVWHRKNAIWPFTTVGRPPQEDTIFGQLIHEITAPLVGQVFNGIKEVHAVDAAGVHPLLLAIGSERYTPYEQIRKPMELLTQAMHLLGTTQTALAKYVLIAAEKVDLSTKNVPEFLKYMLERTDFSRDLHFITRSTCDTLDYSGTDLNEGSRLIWAVNGDKLRDLATELAALPDLPAGFRNPAMVGPGIMVIEGPPHKMPRGIPDPNLETTLAEALENWPGRHNFPLIVISSDARFSGANWNNFLWTTFTRSDPATDIYGVRGKVTAKHWACEAPLIIDARKKDFHAPPLEEDPRVTARIESLAANNGPLAGLI